MFLTLCLSLSDNILSSSYSTSLSSTVCIIFAVFILGNYPIILELFFMLWGAYYSRNYASLFCTSINTELWTLQNNGAIRETEITNYLKINTSWIKQQKYQLYNITMVMEIAFSIYIPSLAVGLFSVWWALTRKGNICEKHCKVLVCIDRLLFVILLKWIVNTPTFSVSTI